jgi:murein DD-endopeptidase MepM/ murein hydrolase activator NlpD
MAFLETRAHRAARWRIVPGLFAAALAASTLQFVCASGSMAQVKAPSKSQLKAPAKHGAATPAEDVRPFAIGTDGSVADQLTALKVEPADAQAAAEAVGKAIEQLDKKAASSGRAVLQSQGANKPKRLVALQLYSADSLAVELHRGNDGTYAFQVAATAPQSGGDKSSSDANAAPANAAPAGAAPANAAAPTAPATAAATPSPAPAAPAAAAPTTTAAGARSVVAGSVNLVKVSSQTLATTLESTGTSGAVVKDLTSAFAGFAPNAAKVELVKGKTSDGTPHVLLASLAEGQKKQSYWWFAPPSQPEGWFDEEGRRLGATGLSEPRPDARISSPFGGRFSYGRRSGGGFHDGIDFESKIGDAIYAAGDGVINHQGWYFEYGRTVKITHADNLETLYAHMSRFADGTGPGSHVHKGDLIGYVGMTGRSTGPHLHFSVIVSGRFVDPQPYLTGKSSINSMLTGDNLVAYRTWQVEVRKAVNASRNEGGWFHRLQGAEPWSSNPFSPSTPSLDRL